MLFNFNDNREVISYFKSEYKEDWEQAYSAYIDAKKSRSKNIFKTIKTRYPKDLHQIHSAELCP